MQPLRHDEIIGTWGSALLPILEDQNIDWSILKEQIDYLIACGINGIYTNGTACEFYTQTEAEFDQLHQILADRCEAAKMPFQIGASHMSPQISLERIRRAKQLHPGAIQVILSDWVPLSDVEMIACLKRFAEEADPIGLVLYNPPHAKRVLTPKEFGMLKKEIPALVGVKVAGGDDTWYESMREHMQGLSVFVPGHFLASGLRRGAHGSYSNIACLQPAGAKRWYDQMLSDPPAAEKRQDDVVRFILTHILPYAKEGFSNQALDKFMATLGGWSKMTTRLRWPYQGIPMSEVEKLHAIARESLPDLFDNP